jgi:beta-glucosidase
MPAHRFPESFVWGAATSAYQIEGSPLADGAGESIWHRFSHTPGKVRNDETGDVTCDHYQRYAEDVALMRELGLRSYRFSLAWGRLLPEGTGRANPAGVAFYDRLIDLLLENGIQPMVTLYHWDLPAALDDRGGWGHRDIVQWFADYARLCFERYADRVPLWATINEPWVVMDGGYLFGVNAPGRKDPAEAARVTHHLLLSHAAAVRVYRSIGKARIGLVVNLEPKEPASTSTLDLAATTRADAYMNRQYLDPVFLGRYPEEMREIFGADWPEHSAEDLAAIQEPMDFLGINYYTRKIVAHDDSGGPVRVRPVHVPDALYTETDWEVHAPSLTRVLEWVRERYGPLPLYVTENGAAFPDPPTAPAAGIDDPLRVHYLDEHLGAVATAISRGVDVRGYYAWSLLDNFEWASGTTKRFGLIHVDFATQKRTIKASGRWYQKFIAPGDAVQ